MRRGRAGSQGGFTLIELLVIVAIIAVLLSLLSPSLMQARELSKQVACKTQMHGLGLALADYYGDWDYNPTLLYKTPEDGRWTGYFVWTLMPYAGLEHPREIEDFSDDSQFEHFIVNEPYFNCPSTRLVAYGDRRATWSVPAGTPYNTWTRSGEEYRIWGTSIGINGWLSYYDAQNPTYTARYPRVTQVASPGRAMILADAGKDWINYGYGPTQSQAWKDKYGIYGPSHNDCMDPRHLSACNALMMDGHADHRQWDWMYPYEHGNDAWYVFYRDLRWREP